MLRWYIRFLEKQLPSLMPFPGLYLLVLDFKNHLESKLPRD